VLKGSVAQESLEVDVERTHALRVARVH
jgi:hypothetical protein